MYEEDYSDIINLPRPLFSAHPKMTMINRAAQFSSFAALAGYDDAIGETARLTSTRIELSEDEKTELDRKLQFLRDKLGTADITYFIPDRSKSGGEYVTKCCDVKAVDEFEREIILRDGTIIPIEDIIAVEDFDYPY